MAPVTLGRTERRGEARRPGGGRRWQPDAVLRPGQPVILINICSRAALVESRTRLRPGAITELQLGAAGTRTSVRGRLDRCHVATLAPLRYHGVVLFEQRLDVEGGERAGQE